VQRPVGIEALILQEVQDVLGTDVLGSITIDSSEGSRGREVIDRAEALAEAVELALTVASCH